MDDSLVTTVPHMFRASGSQFDVVFTIYPEALDDPEGVLLMRLSMDIRSFKESAVSIDDLFFTSMGKIPLKAGDCNLGFNPSWQ
ncbi:MAG: hypothetical protein OXI16_02980 [Chloroflexota bacterium]|nr:hypothetical protein [Chloroflexota bacterium]